MNLVAANDIPELDDIYERVDAVIDQAIEEHSAEVAISYMLGIKKIAELSGKALARLLYKLWLNWHNFMESESDVFEDYIYATLGYAKYTTQRYVRITYLLDDASEKYKEALEQMSMDQLSPIANAVSQGYELEEEDWEKVKQTTTPSEARAVVREIKEQEPRKSGIRLSIDRRGSLWAFNESDRYFIGSLEVADEHETVIKAVRRIINKCSISEA